jgi:retron-type reverse transcriptase
MALDNIKPSEIIELLQSICYKRYSIQLQFTKNTKFSFYHGAKLYDFLCKSLRRDRERLGEDIILDAPESGTIYYKKGDFYNFGITKFGNESGFERNLSDGINRLSGFNPRENGLEGRIKLTLIKELPKIIVPDLSGHEDNIYTIRFNSPLRVERETPLKGHKFFDLDYFDLNRFIKLLFLRFNRLNGKYGTEKYLCEVPVIESSLINHCFHWVDMPYPAKTLGGIIGKLHFYSNLDENLKYLLWFGQIIHSGNNVSFGFGNYSVENSFYRIPIVSAHTGTIERILEYDNLYSSYLHIKSNIAESKSDSRDFDDFESNLNTNIIDIVNEVREKTYEPSFLKGIKFRKQNGEYRYLAVPGIKDRILQRAVYQILSPSVDSLLEESSFAYRKGFSRQSAAHAIMKYNELGYKYALKTDIDAFFDSVNWKVLFDKIDALIPCGYLFDIITKWVSSPVYYNNVKISRTLGLPHESPISPFLVKLYLDEFDKILKDKFKLIRYRDDFVVLCKSFNDVEEARAKLNIILSKHSFKF